MTNLAASRAPESQRFLANARRLWRWLSSPRVFLSLIMLVSMFYMVIIPIYRMLETTFTYQERDIFRVPDAQVGAVTFFHYIRMIATEVSQPYLYDPLMHSLVIAFGATGLAFVMGGLMAWMCVRTDMKGRNLNNQLAILPYIMPGWTMAAAWTVLFKSRISGGLPGVWEFAFGQSPPMWLSSLNRFDIVAFSLSFENDYPNIVKIFDLARLPLRGSERNSRHPLIIMGGVCAFFNPEPVADFFDICFTGEADEMLPEFLDVYRSSAKRYEILKNSITVEGLYVPRFYRISYDADGKISKKIKNQERTTYSLPSLANSMSRTKLPPSILL